MEPVLSSTVTSENCSVPFRIGLTVFHDQLYVAGGVFLMQISLLYGLLQPHKIVAGLGHINVDRIELLDSRQFSRLPISDKSAFGHSRFADTSANWRSDFGISKIDASAFDCGFAAITAASA